MSEKLDRSRMTLGEQMAFARDRQASFRLEADVRRAARERHLDGKETQDLVDRARAAFVFLNGEAVAMEADGKTPVRRADGGLLSVQEWVATAAPIKERPPATFGPSPVAPRVGNRNPWRRESWNVTEQMRILRRDPELAERLKAEAT